MARMEVDDKPSTPLPPGYSASAAGQKGREWRKGVDTGGKCAWRRMEVGDEHPTREGAANSRVHRVRCNWD